MVFRLAETSGGGCCSHHHTALRATTPLSYESRLAGHLRRPGLAELACEDHGKVVPREEGTGESAITAARRRPGRRREGSRRGGRQRELLIAGEERKRFNAWALFLGFSHGPLT
jgi:hypothetical protein